MITNLYRCVDQSERENKRLGFLFFSRIFFFLSFHTMFTCLITKCSMKTLEKK